METKEKENIEQIFIDFVKDFVTKEKQDRILQFLQNKKNWWKIKTEFHSSTPFDKRKLVEIEPNQQYADKIYLKMKSFGTKEECFSLLDYLNDEPYNCKLEEKLSLTVGFLFETIIYCPNTKTGYFEGGHAKDRYILKS
ncbi:MAG: hypothetical protein KBB37_12775 [Bacteroidia bacterium]|nr:hypothetical protein [Bacteroidia bacterium]